MVGKHHDFDPVRQSARMRYNARYSEGYEFIWDHTQQAARSVFRGEEGLTGYPARVVREYIRKGNWTILEIM